MSVNNFFLAQRFAVAGASNDAHKYGYKVLKWYTVHDLPVTPINPVRLLLDARSRVLRPGSPPLDASR